MILSDHTGTFTLYRRVVSICAYKFPCTGKLLVCGSALASLGALFYVMKSRRKSQIVISKEKFFPLRATSGMSSSQGNHSSSQDRTTSRRDYRPSRDGDGDAEDDTHPEGPNIGFGSDPSWLSKGTTGKTDLLHTGNIQGGKLLIIMVGLPGRYSFQSR